MPRIKQQLLKTKQPEDLRKVDKYIVEEEQENSDQNSESQNQQEDIDYGKDFYSSDLYEIEKILEKKLINHEYKYKVKWKGYSESECTWEPRENLIEGGDETKNMLARFEIEYEKHQRLYINEGKLIELDEEDFIESEKDSFSNNDYGWIEQVQNQQNKSQLQTQQMQEINEEQVNMQKAILKQIQQQQDGNEEKKDQDVLNDQFQIKEQGVIDTQALKKECDFNYEVEILDHQNTKKGLRFLTRKKNDQEIWKYIPDIKNNKLLEMYQILYVDSIDLQNQTVQQQNFNQFELNTQNQAIQGQSDNQQNQNIKLSINNNENDELIECNNNNTFDDQSLDQSQKQQQVQINNQNEKEKEKKSNIDEKQLEQEHQKIQQQTIQQKKNEGSNEIKNKLQQNDINKKRKLKETDYDDDYSDNKNTDKIIDILKNKSENQQEKQKVRVDDTADWKLWSVKATFKSPQNLKPILKKDDELQNFNDIIDKQNQMEQEGKIGQVKKKVKLNDEPQVFYVERIKLAPQNQEQQKYQKEYNMFQKKPMAGNKVNVNKVQQQDKNDENDKINGKKSEKQINNLSQLLNSNEFVCTDMKSTNQLQQKLQIQKIGQQVKDQLNISDRKDKKQSQQIEEIQQKSQMEPQKTGSTQSEQIYQTQQNQKKQIELQNQNNLKIKDKELLLDESEKKIQQQQRTQEKINDQKNIQNDKDKSLDKEEKKQQVNLQQEGKKQVQQQQQEQKKQLMTKQRAVKSAKRVNVIEQTDSEQSDTESENENEKLNFNEKDNQNDKLNYRKQMENIEKEQEKMKKQILDEQQQQKQQQNTTLLKEDNLPTNSEIVRILDQNQKYLESMELELQANNNAIDQNVQKEQDLQDILEEQEQTTKKLKYLIGINQEEFVRDENLNDNKKNNNDNQKQGKQIQVQESLFNDQYDNENNKKEGEKTVNEKKITANNQYDYDKNMKNKLNEKNNEIQLNSSVEIQAKKPYENKDFNESNNNQQQVSEIQNNVNQAKIIQLRNQGQNKLNSIEIVEQPNNNIIQIQESKKIQKLCPLQQVLIAEQNGNTTQNLVIEKNKQQQVLNNFFKKKCNKNEKNQPKQGRQQNELKKQSIKLHLPVQQQQRQTGLSIIKQNLSQQQPKQYVIDYRNQYKNDEIKYLQRGNFENDQVEKIKYISGSCRQDYILEIYWQKRSNNFQPGPTLYSYQQVYNISPLTALEFLNKVQDYYEKINQTRDFNDEFRNYLLSQNENDNRQNENQGIGLAINNNIFINNYKDQLQIYDGKINKQKNIKGNYQNSTIVIDDEDEQNSIRYEEVYLLLYIFMSEAEIGGINLRVVPLFCTKKNTGVKWSLAELSVVKKYKILIAYLGIFKLIQQYMGLFQAFGCV
ncbi:Chromo domain protein [Pseudocohnilembus persalinus]|uniref:Chromo domain protein n=1 Tax=Pseudocohnilembus persalinus TaxID=266149 RepID=A0A0V0QLA3_PSEPJ|nr:Chromo domain protein [Pseudocohnilembus persalinus]|eukprot:KRX03005.1 Chromo domain protein [Pseudocohnilembus persalinus]